MTMRPYAVQGLLDALTEIRDRCWEQPDHRPAQCCLAAEDADRALTDFARAEMVDSIGAKP